MWSRKPLYPHRPEMPLSHPEMLSSQVAPVEGGATTPKTLSEKSLCLCMDVDQDVLLTHIRETSQVASPSAVPAETNGSPSGTLSTKHIKIALQSL